MQLHLSLHPLPDENLQDTVLYIILMIVSCKPELTDYHIYKATNQLLQRFALLFI